MMGYDVAIRKRDSRTLLNHEDVRNEAFVALIHDRRHWFAGIAAVGSAVLHKYSDVGDRLPIRANHAYL